MKRKTSVAFSDGLLDNAKKIADALDRSVSYVLEEAVILGLPSVMASEKRKSYEQLMNLANAITFQASKLTEVAVDNQNIQTDEPPGKLGQNPGAAGDADGGAARVVDPSDTSTPTTYPKAKRRKS